LIVAAGSLAGAACGGSGKSSGTGGASGTGGGGGATISSCPASRPAVGTPCSGAFSCDYDDLCRCNVCCFSSYRCTNGSIEFLGANDGCTQLTCADDGGTPDGPAATGCSPGTAVTWDKQVVCNWLNYVNPDAGTLSFPMTSSADTPMVNSVPLPVPMQAGQAYAFSVLFKRSGWEGAIEFWGTDRSCGPGLERLLAEPFPPPSTPKVFCSQTTPAASYTEVLLVYRYSNDPSSGSITDDPVMACPQGTCP